MDEPRKIMMPVDEPGAVRQMEVEAFRQIAEGMKALNIDMRDVRERLIRIESNQLDRTVKDHSARIDALERERDTRSGRDGVLAAICKSPAVAWAVGIVAAAWLALHGGKL